ncbi:hypothetical protein XELAEV_18043000mg [Xenopus laevis]|uniref:Mothers against decapentaplegic homolog n=1 Tax=Xenopus laevis TaxID=8355 RepID=A0A974C4U9_XENLA|nr:hypothetical protein XELAEV_18043000mg [Xenopus laevis]
MGESRHIVSDPHFCLSHSISCPTTSGVLPIAHLHLMFRSRRSVSAGQLWWQRCLLPGRGQGEGAPPSPEDQQNALRPAAHQLIKKLKDEQLRQLAEALESRGSWECGRVFLPWDSRKQPLPPHVLLYKLYRWPNLCHWAELKRLIQCESFWRKSGEGKSLCFNPYHFSRLAAPDTTLSRSTSRDGYWCKLAYWEHRTQVGRLYNVSEPSVHIFHDLPKGSGFCLGYLHSETHNETVRPTRKKIGQGLTLSHEQDGIWWPWAVYKVLPGYSIKVFDSEQGISMSSYTYQGDGPCDPHSICISFAKGWGSSYSRQFITSCPCWLEILLSPSRYSRDESIF